MGDFERTLPIRTFVCKQYILTVYPMTYVCSFATWLQALQETDYKRLNDFRVLEKYMYVY